MNLSGFEEPFKWINTEKYQLVENFPQQISKIYHAEPGIPGRQSWRLFGKLSTGTEFFFSAMCLEDGFKNFGMMSIRILEK